MATLAIRLSRRMARWRNRRRQSGSVRTVTWAASTSRKRSRELPCLLMWPSRSPIPAGLLRRHQPHIAGDLLGAAKAFRRSDDQFERQRRQRPHPQDGSSVAAPPVASPLPAPEPASVPEFSESVDPVTPTGLADVGWPTAPAPTTAVGLSPLVATAPSYAALLRSMPARATGS